MRFSTLIAIAAILMATSDASAIGRRCKCSGKSNAVVSVQPPSPVVKAAPKPVASTCENGSCQRPRPILRLFK